MVIFLFGNLAKYENNVKQFLSAAMIGYIFPAGLAAAPAVCSADAPFF